MKRGSLIVFTLVVSLAGFFFFGRYIGTQLQPQQALSQPLPQAEDTVLSYPYAIAGTPLTVLCLGLYEGDMIETDSDVFLTDAAALEVYNSGDKAISLAQIRLRSGDSWLAFLGTNIPAGARILLVEQNGAAWPPEGCTACTGWVSYDDMAQLAEDTVAWENVDMGTVAVSNLTQTPLEDVWIFYKSYLPESEMYLGGITYIEQIPLLEPGQTLALSPYRYAGEYSRIVKIAEID